MKMEKLKKIRSVAVFCSSRLPASPEYADAVVEFGKYLAEHDMTLVRHQDFIPCTREK